MKNPDLFQWQEVELVGSEDSGVATVTDVTLRDLFAAFCAAGELAAQSPDFIDYTLDAATGDPALLAKRAYVCADALLARREAPDGD